MSEKSPHWTTWISNLPASQTREIRDRIIQECGISRPTFYRWRGQYEPVKKLAQEKIREIAGQDLDFTFHAIDKARKPEPTE
jgi:hypothetical protein